MTLDSRHTNSATARPKQRWWWFSNERAPVGTSGPFGPIEARTVAEAKRIAAARAKSSDLTLHSVEATYHREGLDA